jgi:hypothetical protein
VAEGEPRLRIVGAQDEQGLGGKLASANDPAIIVLCATQSSEQPRHSPGSAHGAVGSTHLDGRPVAVEAGTSLKTTFTCCYDDSFAGASARYAASRHSVSSSPRSWTNSSAGPTTGYLVKPGTILGG